MILMQKFIRFKILHIFLMFSSPVVAVDAQSQYCWDKSLEATEPTDYQSLRGYSFHFENDAVEFKKGTNDDRDYTQGTTVDFFGDRSVNTLKLINCPLDAVDFLSDALFSFDVSGTVSDSITLGLKAFTPDDLSDPNPIFNDRPYASIFFLTDTKNREFSDSHKAHRKYLKTALTLGFLDNNIARNYQSLVHEVGDFRDARLPKGWGNQITNNGQPLVNYNMTVLHNLDVTQNSASFNSNFFGFIGGNLGNVNQDLYAGGGFRLGFYTSEYLVLPGISQVKSLNFSPPNKIQIKPKDKSCLVVYECFLFGSYGQKRVFENHLITGFSGDTARCQECSLEPNMTFYSLGLSIQITPHTKISLVQNYNTKEFSSSTNPNLNDDHFYGGIHLSFNFTDEKS